MQALLERGGGDAVVADVVLPPSIAAIDREGETSRRREADEHVGNKGVGGGNGDG